jgi:hypothetical protein
MAESEILRAIQAFGGLFRTSSVHSDRGEAQYALHLRYAKHKKSDHFSEGTDVPDALTSEDLDGLIGFVTERANQEALRRQAIYTNLVAVAAAVISAIAAIVASLAC